MKDNIRPFKRFPRMVYMREEIELFLHASKRSALANFISLIAVCLLLYGNVSITVLATWAGLQIAYLWMRRLEHLKLRKALKSQEPLAPYLRRMILLIAVGGMIWGVLLWLMVIYLENQNFIFYLLAITFGVSAGSVVTLSALYVAFNLFISSMLILQASALLYLGDTYVDLIAVLSLIFLAILSSAGKSMHKSLRKNILFAKRLKKSQKELSSLNSNLRKQVQEKTCEIREAYYRDELTGLPNLFMCRDVIEEGEDNYLLLLDISGFSDINKAYGKHFADEVLKSVAYYLRQNVKVNMSLFRGESDRFLIHIKHSSIAKVQNFCRSLFAYFDLQELEIDDDSLHISFSIGIASMEDKDSALMNVEFALGGSKKLGTKQYAFYNTTQEKEKILVKNMKITKYLIENESFVPYYQAIKDIKNDKIYKYEVLARGIYHDKVIPPISFLDAARRLGVLTTITRIMINKSFLFFEKNDMEFSINITEQDLGEGYLLPFLKMKLKKHGIKASRVTFEILENINLDKSDNRIDQALIEIRKLGCKIAIDDFGVENSNFLRLLELDFDILKLDGIFIKDLLTSEKSQRIVEAVVSLAQTLGIHTVAEYVENEEIYQLLEKLGVDFAQGYYINKPQEKI